MRCDVPFVGRDHERALLDAAVQLVRDGRSGIISIVGEAGAGKTRLADEIVEPLEDEAIVIRTACAPYGESNVVGAGDQRAGGAARPSIREATAPTSRPPSAPARSSCGGSTPTTTAVRGTSTR